MRRKEVRWGLTTCGCSLARLFTEIDEIVGNSDLGTNVTELTPNSEEEVDLLSEWSWVVFSNLHLLCAHIGICDLGHWRQEKEDDQQPYEASNTKVCPLYILQSLVCIDSFGKEYTGC